MRQVTAGFHHHGASAQEQRRPRRIRRRRDKHIARGKLTPELRFRNDTGVSRRLPGCGGNTMPGLDFVVGLITRTYSESRFTRQALRGLRLPLHDDVWS